MSSVRILYASTSGHTEYVVDGVARALHGHRATLIRIERATPEDLLAGDVLVLACGSWNTGGIEGQMNPHMHAFLKEKAAAIDLKGKRTCLIALGDDRYRYTAGAEKHLQEFVESHGGTVLGEPLIIVNEPYGQEEKILSWTKKILPLLS